MTSTARRDRLAATSSGCQYCTAIRPGCQDPRQARRSECAVLSTETDTAVDQISGGVIASMATENSPLARERIDAARRRRQVHLMKSDTQPHSGS
jgi:hypothetical protein